MTSLVVTMEGRITLNPDFLQHLGITPGERLELDKLAGGELRLKAARPAETIDSFIGRHAGKMETSMKIEAMNEIISAAWAGEG